MIPWLTSLLWDDTAFERFGRALVFALGQALHDGMLPGLNGSKAWWLGPFVSVAALVIGAGDKTPENVKALAETLPKP